MWYRGEEDERCVIGDWWDDVEFGRDGSALVEQRRRPQPRFRRHFDEVRLVRDGTPVEWVHPHSSLKPRKIKLKENLFFFGFIGRKMVKKCQNVGFSSKNVSVFRWKDCTNHLLLNAMNEVSILMPHSSLKPRKMLKEKFFFGFHRAEKW